MILSGRTLYLGVTHGIQGRHFFGTLSAPLHSFILCMVHIMKLPEPTVATSKPLNNV